MGRLYWEHRKAAHESSMNMALKQIRREGNVQAIRTVYTHDGVCHSYFHQLLLSFLPIRVTFAHFLLLKFIAGR